MGLGLSLTACSLRDYSYLTAGLDDTSDETTDETLTSSDESTMDRDAGPEAGVGTETTETSATETSGETDAGESSSTETSETSETSEPDSGTGTTTDMSSTDTGDTGPVNLIGSGGFEDGYPGWSSFGNALLSLTSNNPHGGKYCLRTSGRTDAWMGPSYGLLTTVQAGKTYQATAWVRVDVPEPTDAGEEFIGANVRMSLKYKCQGQSDSDGAYYTTIHQHTTVRDTWVELSAIVNGDHPSGAVPCETETPVTEYALYFEGTAEMDIYVDDVTLYEL